MSADKPLLLLGVGQVARAVIALARGTRTITGTTRDPRKVFQMVEMGITPLIMPMPSCEILESVANDADVVVSFPPDGETDAIFAPAVKQARRVIYISTTGVYGKREGVVDDTTAPDDSAEEKLDARLHAESLWQEQGAIILRVPGIYGPDSGLHLSLRNGKYKIPGDGSRNTSRIHVEDLASVILAMLAGPSLLRDCYVIGDRSPCPQIEIVTWLCNELSIPLPPAVPIEEVHRTLRGNRRVDPSGLLNELAIELKYPNYRDGYRALLEKPIL
ncbi:MAG: NAD(P)H-binding protein [Candidatus Obscuribacterales bacterium]|nr:NAD(P)H-binding protein [Candidatus Obscuribacterales bacterium]